MNKLSYHPLTLFGSSQWPVASLKTVFFGHAPSRGWPVLKQLKNCWQSLGLPNRSWFPNLNILKLKNSSWYIVVDSVYVTTSLKLIGVVTYSSLSYFGHSNPKNFPAWHSGLADWSGVVQASILGSNMTPSAHAWRYAFPSK